ncbi:MAG: serine/threonine protein kinase [Proteobacteria bacterium]|nr:MAG: serine/threonine protein kinase [Pseudomonadota bacterium]
MPHPRFTDLGPDAALEAVEAAGLRPTGHCSMLRCLENRVWDLRLEDASHVVVKFYRPGRWSRAGIEDEHRFLLDLRDAEIPVCAPLALAGGGTVGEHAGIWFGVWPRTGGREPDELTDEELAILGRLLARIHDVGARRRPNDRLVLDADTALLDPLDELLDRGALPDSCADRYAAAVDVLADVYAARLEDVPFLRIHGDCHLGNLLRGRDGWFFLDFDDFATGPAVHDVWVLVPGQDGEARRQRDALLDGYRQFRDFDPRWLSLVEPLRAARMLKISSWIARRWDEAAFRSTFPHFGTDLYWEREMRDLEDLVARLTEA